MNPKTAFACIVVLTFTHQHIQADPKSDSQLFSAGATLTFDSTGHAKANGMRVKLSYPKTWKASEGQRPHIIQRLESEDGHGSVSVTLQSSPLPPKYDHDLTADEKKELISRPFLMTYIPKAAKVIAYKETMLDREPCGMIEMIVTTEVAGTQILICDTIYFLPTKGQFIMIHASSSGKASEGEGAIVARFIDAKPVLQQIAASCVLVDKWAK